MSEFKCPPLDCLVEETRKALLALGADALDPSWRLYKAEPEPKPRKVVKDRCAPMGSPATAVVVPYLIGTSRLVRPQEEVA